MKNVRIFIEQNKSNIIIALVIVVVLVIISAKGVSQSTQPSDLAGLSVERLVVPESWGEIKSAEIDGRRNSRSLTVVFKNNYILHYSPNTSLFGGRGDNTVFKIERQ